MSVTTIKVDRAVRDQLAVVARARGTTMGALLAEVARRLEEEQRWAAIRDAYTRAQAEDPQGWQDYLSELAMWDAHGAEPDPAAAQEWPEYNR